MAAEFFRPPAMNLAHDATIRPGGVLTRVIVPPSAAGTKAAYHKQTERESTVRSASIVMGWVAPTPRRASESEQLLVGKPLTEDLARQAARAAVASATPLSKNGYKVPVLETVVRRTIMAATTAS